MRTRAAILAVVLLLFLAGSIIMIALAASDVIEGNVTGYLTFGVIAALCAYGFGAIVYHLLQGRRPRTLSAPERAALVTRGRRLQAVLAVLLGIGAVVSLAHPWWSDDVEWWRFAQGGGWAILAGALVWQRHRTRPRKGAHDAA